MLLMIDNYDSFTFNLVQYLQELGAEVRVERNDALSVAQIEALAPDKIVISRTGGVGSTALCDQVGSFLNSSAGYTLYVDRRNDPIRPTRGWSPIWSTPRGRSDSCFS